MVRQTPYLAVLIVAVAAAFGVFFSHGGHPETQCQVPRVMNVGSVIWVPARTDPLTSPAWSVTSVRGWQEFTCNDNAQWSKSGGN